MRRLVPSLLLAATLAAPPVQADPIYQFRDAKGRIHLSNKKLDDNYQPFDYMRLPAGTDAGELDPLRAGGLPEQQVRGRQRPGGKGPAAQEAAAGEGGGSHGG